MAIQSRFTAKGVTADDKGVVLAYELNEAEFKVTLQVIPAKSLTAEALEKLETAWVSGEAFEFPEDTQLINPSLEAESILPEDIRSEETGKIRAKQNEWAYQLVTNKLWEAFIQELTDLKKRAEELATYDKQLFEDAKAFWESVLNYKKGKDISQDRLDMIKEEVNGVFEKLKTFRKVESAEFEQASAKLRDFVVGKLEDVKKRAEEKVNFKNLVEELKNIQQESRKNRYTKSDDINLRKAFDTAFHFVNEQRNSFFSDKNSVRIKGLQEVIHKMESSLNRDKKDLEYMEKKASSPNIKQLELQLIKVKSNMLKDAVASKEEKLKDIYATLEKLQKQTDRANKPKKEGEKEETAPVADNNDAKDAVENLEQIADELLKAETGEPKKDEPQDEATPSQTE
jgi:hypothetical protein